MYTLENILSILKKTVKAEEIYVHFQGDNLPIKPADLNKIEVKFPKNEFNINGKLIFTFLENLSFNETQNTLIKAFIEEIIKIESKKIKRKKLKSNPLYKEILVENLISNMTEGVLIFDTKHSITHFNKAGKKLFGSHENPSIYAINADLSLQNDGSLTLLTKDQFPSKIALKGGKVENTLYFIKNEIHKKGMFVQVNANPIRNMAGDIIAAVVTVNDITISKKQENEIKQQRDLLQQASRLAEVGYWEINLETGTVYWSDITRKIHETMDSYEPTLEEGISFYDDESKPIITKAVNKGIETGEGWDVQLEIITAQGNKKWVRSISKCYQELGKTVKIAGVFQDISEEKKKEEELIASRNKALTKSELLTEEIVLKEQELNLTRKRYSTLYNNAPDLMASIDIKTRTIIDCNEQTAISLGYLKEELIGKHLLDIYHTKSHKKAKAAFNQFLKNGELHDVRLLLEKKDGSVLNVMLNASAIRNSEGKIIQTNSVWRDITELVITENKLKKLNINLEQIVKERTKELASANEEIEDFTYMATHDLKAPIANIKGHFGIIKAELGMVKNHIINDCFKWIDSSLEIAENKIQSIVKVAQLQFQDANRAENLDAEIEIKSILKDMNLLILESKSEIKLIVIERFSVNFIKENFNSIITNLVHNAIKYSKPNINPKITITINKIKNQRFISVSDMGLGFDPIAQEEKIFGMFERIHDHVEGDGMGLHLVKKIIDKSGGRITVESKINQGSTFTIYFKN